MTRHTRVNKQGNEIHWALRYWQVDALLDEGLFSRALCALLGPLHASTPLRAGRPAPSQTVTPGSKYMNTETPGTGRFFSLLHTSKCHLPHHPGGSVGYMTQALRPLQHSSATYTPRIWAPEADSGNTVYKRHEALVLRWRLGWARVELGIAIFPDFISKPRR